MTVAGDKGSRGIFRCEGGVVFDLVFTVPLKGCLRPWGSLVLDVCGDGDVSL